MKRFNFVIALLPLTLMTGCITSTIRGKQAELCSHLAVLNTSISVFKRVSSASTSTVSSLKQAEEQVSVAFRDFRGTAKDSLQEAKDEELEKDYKNLEKAYEDLDKEVKNIPDKSTIMQAIASTSDNVAAVESAVTQMKSGLRCP